jgi:hypothetical protein
MARAGFLLNVLFAILIQIVTFAIALRVLDLSVTGG